MKKHIRELGTFGIMVLGILAARSSLADHYEVPTGSMQPTVEIGDHVLVNKLAFGFRLPLSNIYLFEFEGPQRGDVVVLSSPEDGAVLLKRMVAVPGDQVVVMNGQLAINGQSVPVQLTPDGVLETLGLPHLLKLTYGGGPDFGPVTLPTGKYLVLGDNRGNSKDGRYFGLVDRCAILGRAVAVYLNSQGLTWRLL